MPVITTAANSEEDEAILLEWSPVYNAKEYQVWRAKSESGTPFKIATTDGVSISNTSIEMGTTYYYKVRVILTNGDDVYSEAVSNDCIIPGVVFDITTGHNHAGKPTLKWANITGAASYEV